MSSPQFNVDAHLKLWEKAIDVQQHFNDIGWRIRALGLTVITFTLGATGVTYANTTSLDLFGRWTNPAFLVPVVGAVIWISFWFTDAGWFHKLLVGAVMDGIRLEKLLKEHGIHAALGSAIGDASPIRFYKKQKRADFLNKVPKTPRRYRGADAKLHSKHKLNLFYSAITLLLVITSGAIFCAPSVPSSAEKVLIPKTADVAPPPRLAPTPRPAPITTPGASSSTP